jgi:hypothetical protein
MVDRDEQSFRVTEPVIEPRAVGSFGTQDVRTRDREAAAMTVSIDPDAVVGLREAFERQKAGSQLDVISQWRVMLPHDVKFAPIVLLYLRLPEVNVEFNICFDLDEYKNSLAVAAGTGRVILLEPALNQALLTDSPAKAFAEHLSLGVMVADAEPLRRALQQRFDLPFQDNRDAGRVVEAQQAREALNEFRLNAKEVDDIGVATSDDGLRVIAVVDESAADALQDAGDEESRWASWASVQAGPYLLARLDVLTGDRRLRSWLLPDPAPELVRAASAGPHLVVVLNKRLADDPDSMSKQLRGGVAFPVHEAPEAMRALLR